jgi:ribosomal protein L32
MWYFTSMTSSGLVKCSYCGETISRKAAACPHCGSDEQTGWSDNTYLDGIDLGGDDDYEELRAREFSPEKRKPLPLWQLVTAGFLLVLFIIAVVRSIP